MQLFAVRRQSAHHSSYVPAAVQTVEQARLEWVHSRLQTVRWKIQSTGQIILECMARVHIAQPVWDSNIAKGTLFDDIFVSNENASEGVFWNKREKHWLICFDREDYYEQ